ncbi:hypothetical protein [Rhodopila sp.]|uniref:hypothetical protein n=1 Tax=Rhodopila sp. TaxID=2480087 RepID=UPI002BCF366E|nr:hypothetical protein [Rhodopila sp.]HVZ09516.1 hypothetical protein [Rhodopila sp.]
MLRRALLLIVLAVAGCAGGGPRTYFVKFQPFSAIPDADGQQAVQAAIAYAKADALRPVMVDGFHYGQYPNEGDTMRADRVRVVVDMLVQGGIGRERIQIMGEGIDYAQGSPMPSLPPGTVRVGVGF